MKKTNAKKTTQSPTNNTKLPNINKTSKSPKEDTKSTKKGKPNEKKVNNPTNLKTEAKEENKEAQKKKMEELKERKKKRMEKEKKEEQRDKQVYEQIVKEFQDNKTRVNTETNVVKRLTNAKKESDINSLNSMQLPQIKISEKKTQAILEESGMLDAYKYLIIQLCKNGFPTTNLFEYSAFVIKNYEKKWKEKKSKMTKEKVEKYWQEKKEELKNMEKKNNNSIDSAAAYSMALVFNASKPVSSSRQSAPPCTRPAICSRKALTNWSKLKALQAVRFTSDGRLSEWVVGPTLPATHTLRGAPSAAARARRAAAAAMAPASAAQPYSA